MATRGMKCLGVTRKLHGVSIHVRRDFLLENNDICIHAEDKFQNPSNMSEFLDYTKPPDWSKYIQDLNGSLQNPDFMV